jgi:hypothetical protein
LDVAWWGAAWIVVAVVLGILVAKGIAVGMGTHPRAPYAEESAADEMPTAQPNTSEQLLAEIAALTDALADGDAVETEREPRRQRTG